MKMLLCVMTGCAAVVPLLYAQAPPVKMGLWESTSTSTMTGLQLPPQVVEQMKALGRPIPGSTPTTTIVEVCLTPEKWQTSFQNAARRDQECQTKSMKVDAAGMSMDVACRGDGGNSTMHTQVTFVNAEKVHSTTRMEVVSARAPQPMIMNATGDSVYQGADCKGISPDAPKVLSR